MTRLRALWFGLPALVGCGDISMNQQAKYLPQAPAAALSRGTESQAPPEGTVSQDRLAYDAAGANPPPVTAALVARGRERHDIACRPCHGTAGNGDGTIVARGFPPPLAYADPRVRALTGRQLYDVIANGYGVMYPQAERVAPADRWAIVAYIRATQIAATAHATPGGGPASAGSAS